jgi:uncharacterized protein YhdP
MLTQLQRRLPLRAFARILLGSLAALAVLLAAGLVAIRFWLWPSVPQWRDDLLAQAQSALSQRGLTLQAGPVVADWEHWLRPRLTVSNLSLRGAQDEPLLQLGQVQATIGLSSLASLWRLEPIFSEIRIEQPSLLAVRDKAGAIEIAGFRVGASRETPATGPDSKLIEWVLRQGKIRVSNGTVLWRDAAKNKSAEIHDLEMAARNFGLRHSWTLRGRVEEPIGDAFSLEGSFRHPLFGGPAQFADWSGELFVQFDRVDLSELLGLVTLPKEAPLKINSGTGAFKAWASMSSKSLRDLTVDFDLASASLQWGQGRRPLTLERFSGRVETELSGNKQRIKIADMSLQSVQLAQPVRVTSAELMIEEEAASGESRVHIRSKLLDLSAVRWLIGHLPVNPVLKEQVARLSPSGYLSDLDLSWVESPEQPFVASLTAGFDALALSAGPAKPSFSGLSGRLKASESQGSIQLKGSKASLMFPAIFEEPRIDFERLSAELRWQLASTPDARGVTPLTLTVSEFSASNPDLALEASATYETSSDGAGHLDLKGSVTRVLPHRLHRYVPLAAGPQTRQWLRLALKESAPYRAQFELSGPLHKFPFQDPQSGRFLVTAQVEGGRLQPAPGWPTLTGINAEAIFDRAGFELRASQARFASLQSPKIHAQIIDMAAPQTLLRVQGDLRGDLQQFFSAANQSPVKAWLGGLTETMSGKGETTLALDLNLNLSDDRLSRYFGALRLGRGTLSPGVNLPLVAINSGAIEFNEFGLSALTIQGEALGGPLKATRQPVAGFPNRSQLVLDGRATGRGLEQWASQVWGVNWRGQLSGATPFSVQIDVGGGPTRAVVKSSLAGLRSTLASPLAKQEAERWGLHVEYRGGRPETEIALDSPKAKGRILWQPRADSEGLLRAFFERFWLDSASRADAQELAQSDKNTLAHNWPRLDLGVEDFRVGARQWGKVDMQARPVHATRSWEISTLTITNADALLTGQGRWATRALDPRSKASSRTVLDMQLEVKNGGALLARAGYPEVVRDTAGKIEGQLSWPGSPLAFSGGALSGTLGMNLEKGRFLKAEPGVARLVGILNLQTLPRRIKLDFSDVFSEGFTYERIRGDLEFLEGEVTTRNLRIVGVQASVLLEGSASIRNETQDIRVLVLPEVNAGLASLGYAALVNPAVGLGAFLAQYVLRDPVRRLLAYEYQLTGRWEDPVVTPIAREPRADIPELSPSTK